MSSGTVDNFLITLEPILDTSSDLNKKAKTELARKHFRAAEKLGLELDHSYVLGLLNGFDEGVEFQKNKET